MTPIERLSSLVVGAVESVSPGEVRVLLELDAPHATALNTGTPAPFPRINSYVLIPNEAGATVAYISWIGIERSPYPKRSGLKDFGLIDLPFPLRKMSVSPVGTLTRVRDKVTGGMRHELSRGVMAFPSVGDQVLMPTAEQVEAIVGARDSDRRVRIGASPLASNAAIMVDPDKLFGRHLAVLGNTGSGKSCTVAGLIRWSLDAASRAIADGGRGDTPANARFIVLDPNGEYARAFADLGDKVRVFRVPPIAAGERALEVPAWLWSGHEWTAVAQAQPGAQRPLLMQGLRELKSGQTQGVPREAVVRRYLVSYATRVSAMLNSGTQAFAGSPRSRFECARLLETIQNDCNWLAQGVEEPTTSELTAAAARAETVVNSRRSGAYFNDFSVGDLESVRDALLTLAETLPDLGDAAPISEDAPLFFDVNLLAEHLERTASEQGANVAGFVSTLGLRIRGMLADHRLGAVVGHQPPVRFEDWLSDYVGDSGGANGPMAIVDLSLVPSEMVHIMVAVLARLVFESLQRYRRVNAEGKALPTVLVLEEAHTFVRRGGDDAGPAATPGQLCRETFERIAREGRKFGLGLVLSSQRPSELSPTVLAQCNTFLLHRIVNDADQNLVGRLVPDNVAGLLRELPSLPSRQAVLLGWATPIPVLVEVDELPDAQRPQSSDPDFWGVWTLREPRAVDWAAIVADWTSS
ncbi:ATP-binding protein [Roseateles sp. BYS78W]|uniref:ATP-binding protein n=1 Tax=Pelomonas candidula TaxID=3299025 RepID=A0ABW7HFM3_9BURK